MFGRSYFVRALDITDFTVPKNIEIHKWFKDLDDYTQFETSQKIIAGGDL